MQDVTFTDRDMEEVHFSHDDPVVISLTIANFDVKRVPVDNGSSVDVLFYEAFQRMKLSPNRLQK